MTILVSGAVGFVGFHVCRTLLHRGERVIGCDNFDASQDTRIKRQRLDRITDSPHFRFHRIDVSEYHALGYLLSSHPDIEVIVHLAARTGNLADTGHPHIYTQADINGHITMMELARRLPKLRHVVFGSSAGVYGHARNMPMCVGDPENPVSLSGVMKLAGEKIAGRYARVYDLPVTGLRFFTLYGPWAREDIAVHSFTRCILSGRPVPLFHGGNLYRDFTYIDDAVDAIIKVISTPGKRGELSLYNIGSGYCDSVLEVLTSLERFLGRRARRKILPRRPEEVVRTSADIEPARNHFRYCPKISISDGLGRFVGWFHSYQS